MNNIDIEMKKVEEAFNRIVRSEALLGSNLIEKLDKALSGGKLPSEKEWKEYFKNDLKSMSLNEFVTYYKLTEEQKNDIETANYLIEYLLFETVKQKIGWGLLTEPAVKSIKKTLQENNSKGLLEVGCGSGYWTKVLSSRLDIDVQGCDLFKRKDTPKSKYFNTLNISAVEALDTFKDYDVLMVWTDTGSVGLEVAKKMTPGRFLIISGNIEVTGSLDFYKSLDRYFDIQEHKSALSFSGANERTYILQKRESPKLEKDNLKIFETQFVRFKNFLNFNMKIKHR